MSKPPLDLHAEVTTASGARYRWKADGPADSKPRGLSFSTKRGDGFSTANVTLSRRIDRDYVDLNLFDDFALIGADGSIAYEGRLGGNPRSMQDTHAITANFVGWMAHARDRKFREIYVDRDFAKWTGPSVAQKFALTAAGYAAIDPSVDHDPVSFSPALTASIPEPWGAGGLPRVEGWYDAGPDLAIGSLYAAWSREPTLVNSADANWSWLAWLSTDDVNTVADSIGNQRAAGPAAFTTTASDNKKRFAHVGFLYTAAGGAATGRVFRLFWTCLAVYGTHGLTKRGSQGQTTAFGFYASDVIKNIASRFCPKLDTSGVQNTTFSIPQLAFTERTDPYDGFLECNKYHRWELAVWEGKKLCYYPVDLSDYDWEVRLSDKGTTVDLQGDSTDGLANGIVVQFTNLLDANKTGVVSPETHPNDLADRSPNNPANVHGLKVWTEIQLSTPTTPEAAVQIGRLALAEFNQAKAPGSITVKGHIRDRAGNWQPAWKVRAGETVAITDHPNDRPRIIGETTWNHDALELTIAVDSTLQRVDAILDRQTTALQAANLLS
jgi:hypothetical protein